MQLSRLYSNKPKIFVPIEFNSVGDDTLMNVVFGEVRDPKNRKKDSHNLGKTTLLNLIDFCLLKGMSPDQFLAKHRDRFEGFDFFLEIALNDGAFATVRRGADNPNDVSLKRHDARRLHLVEASEDEWDHPHLSREEAVKLLDGWLDLRVLKPYDFRKAITYFLRSQGDYSDELQLQKFRQGKDRDWKPFVAHLFGLDEKPVKRKYELDDVVERLSKKRDEQQAEVQFVEEQLPELNARIHLLQGQVQDLEAAIDAFSFDDQERRMIEELSGNIEREISELNDRYYNNSYDQKQIDAALKHKDKFDLSEVEEVFGEAKINFPKALKKSYEELVAFNKKVTHERNVALRSRLKFLIEEEAELEARKRELDQQRQRHLRLLRNTDAFDKFKDLQREVTKQSSNLVYLEEQRKKLEAVVATATELREAERERGRATDEIKAMIQRQAPVYERFSQIFNSYCQRVLNHAGIFHFRVNSSGNLDYTIGLSNEMGALSSQSEGTSYRKLVCALFDLALLRVYDHQSFFRFVYHDGVLEGLDDRKKIALLDVVREQIRSSNSQYVLTLIDSDVPRNAAGNRIPFEDDETVLRLHDGGADGRLFRMAEF